MSRRIRVAVLVSGEGTTLDALARRWQAEGSGIEVVVVISDRPGIGALGRAKALGLPVELVDRTGVPREEWSQRLTERLRAHGSELVVLAGFLSILPAEWVAEWEGRAINLHPSLLPRYGGRGMHGLKVHEAVLAAGDRETGVTVHLVTGAVDAGPALEQRTLAVRPDDTPASLRARLAPLEIDALDRAVRRFASGELPLPYR